MNLIFGQDNANLLRQKYTVLDLDDLLVTKEDGTTEYRSVFCLVPGDKLPVTELPQLENWIKLHNDMRSGFDRGEYLFCRQCIEHLMGKFGGELDSYYDVVLQRIDEKEKAVA